MSTSTNAGGRKACAACKHQRRKCDADCRLAPFFPANDPVRFQNAHSLFGVGNMLKILDRVDPSEHAVCMRSIIYESDVRAQFPVEGCLGIIRSLYAHLRQQLDELEDINRFLVAASNDSSLGNYAYADDGLTVEPMGTTSSNRGSIGVGQALKGEPSIVEIQEPCFQGEAYSSRGQYSNSRLSEASCTVTSAQDDACAVQMIYNNPFGFMEEVFPNSFAQTGNHSLSIGSPIAQKEIRQVEQAAVGLPPAGHSAGTLASGSERPDSSPAGACNGNVPAVACLQQLWKNWWLDNSQYSMSGPGADARPEFYSPADTWIQNDPIGARRKS